MRLPSAIAGGRPLLMRTLSSFRPWFCAGLALLGGVARSEVRLASLFTDHAVLQRDRPVPVWGTAEAGEEVAVTFAGQTARARAAADGCWRVVLGAMPARSEGGDLVASGRNVVAIHDVVVGEVWLCGGQSNMAWPVKKSRRAAEEIAAADRPLVRHLRLALTTAEAPAATVDTRGGWQRASPGTAGDFTAVGYFFARELQPALGVPVGLINAAWDGSRIESWLSLDAAVPANRAAFDAVRERWRQVLADYPRQQAEFDRALPAWTEAEAKSQATGDAEQAAFHREHPRPRLPLGSGSFWTPGAMYNGMIAPLRSYAFRGVLWYQGESNADRPADYRTLFPALIADWRAHLGPGDFPFYWAQLPNYRNVADPTGRNWTLLREAQTEALALPQTGQVVSVDLGQIEDNHPRNKQEFGRRLAVLAKVRTYGLPGEGESPLFLEAKPEGRTMRVRFRHVETGLIAAGGPPRSLELAGADGKFQPAFGVIEGDALLVSSPHVKQPVAVRYAWSDTPEANLYNGAALPVTPFRSDDW